MYYAKIDILILPQTPIIKQSNIKNLFRKCGYPPSVQPLSTTSPNGRLLRIRTRQDQLYNGGDPDRLAFAPAPFSYIVVMELDGDIHIRNWSHGLTMTVAFASEIVVDVHFWDRQVHLSFIM